MLCQGHDAKLGHLPHSSSVLNSIVDGMPPARHMVPWGDWDLRSGPHF